MPATQEVRSFTGNGRTGGDGEAFRPRLISWNTTFRCNLRCPHCYLDAGPSGMEGELSTAEGKMLIDQIAELGKPLLIFSGGEPLLRGDLFELARYASGRGLRPALGTNGTLITDAVSERLRESGIHAVAISIDSTRPERHDAFRGVKGAWKGAMKGIGSCIRSGIDVQVNTTVTRENYHEIDEIMALAEQTGARSFHLFFMVPTGRGAGIRDISPEKYEEMIGGILGRIDGSSPMKVRPVCAPQFLRIASQRGMDLSPWGNGCIAGQSYCRIYPTGEVTPCPYLPIPLGNIRKASFGDIWSGSPVLLALRDRGRLEGKCGRCNYRELCGGCRARAYGLSGASGSCGGLHRPEDLHDGFLAEDPSCPYRPTEGGPWT